MIKDTELWSIERLRSEFPGINFPEYQREPNVWSRAAKQRLVDSILRQFDIASIYLYEDVDGSLDCIDGRQRLGAIMAFMAANAEDEDNGFGLRISNEIYPEEEPRFAEYNGEPFEAIQAAADEGDDEAEALLRRFLEYEVTIVKLAGSRQPEEFNLQFTRLNLGTIINSGEKLHAMVGDMRDICFGPMAENPYLDTINIPTRRYAKEQVAAQVLAQIFSRWKTEEWTRTRHYDLQRFFKEENEIGEEERELIAEVDGIMRLLAEALEDPSGLRNRAVSVSTVLLAWEEGVSDERDATEVARFMEEFLCRLLWQLGRGLDAHPEYRYMNEFNRHVTQASVERYAVEGRHEVLSTEFHRWQEAGHLRGDLDYRERVGSEASVDCREG